MGKKERKGRTELAAATMAAFGHDDDDDGAMMAEGGCEFEAGQGIGDRNLHDHVLGRFGNSTAPEHRHLCAVTGAIAQGLTEQGLELTPTAFFAACMGSLERQLPSPGAPADPATTAICAFLALVLPRTPPPVLHSKSRAGLSLLTAFLVENSENKDLAAATAKWMLSCIACFLRAGDKGDWPNLAPAFVTLARHCQHTRPKVRKRAHQCTAEVLVDFRGSPAHGMASEVILSMFEKSLKAVGDGTGGSEKNRSGGGNNTGALQVLFLLNGLKDILPVMSEKTIGKSLMHFSSLLDLRQPILIKHVLNVLHSLCLSMTADIPAKGLADVLTKISESLSWEKKPADETVVAARIIRDGMDRLHTIDRNHCIVIFPGMYHALSGVLASEQEEAVHGAAECLKSLIRSCVDEPMIQEGAVQLKAGGHYRRVGPTPIEKVCATAESTLGPHYSGSWHKCLQVISTLFEKLGSLSSSLMASIVKALAELQELSDNEITCRKQLHKSIGAAVAAMGPEAFLTLLPLEMDSEDLAKSRVWLLPILKRDVVGASLQFFSEKILPLAHQLHARSQKCLADGRPVASRNLEACAQSLWALLPSFCHYAVDTAQSFRAIAKHLGDTLNKQPELRGIICHSLQILIRQNKEACGYASVSKKSSEKYSETRGENKAAEEKAKAHYTAVVAGENIKVMASFSRNFLPLLFNIFISSPSEKRGDLQITIKEFGSISDKKTVKDFFISIMQKLLKATKEASESVNTKGGMLIDAKVPDEESASSKRCIFMDLAISLLQGLDEEGATLLLTATKPALQDSDGAVQKKAYKVLATLCEENEDFVAERSNDILEIMLETMSSCNLSAKHRRLKCLSCLILHLLKAQRQNVDEVLTSFMSEIVLATKETNTKTRNTAYDLLVQMGHSLENVDTGGSNEKLFQFFQMIVGCLAGSTPHMISAAVTSLARLIYEFSSLCGTIPELLPSVFLLLHSKSREVIKSVLGFVKVAITRQPLSEIQQHLKGMVEGLLLWSDDSKNHFKAKVRVILEMLVRKCGEQAVAAVMPREHAKLLSNIVKVRDRKIKAKSIHEDETKSIRTSATTTRGSRWNHTEVFSDDEDDQSNFYGPSSMAEDHVRAITKTNTVKSSKKQKKNGVRRLQEDAEADGNEPLDLLNTQKTRLAFSLSHTRKRSMDGDEDLEIAPDGRMIIPGEDDNAGGRGRSKRKFHGAEMGDDDDNNDAKSTRSKKSNRSSLAPNKSSSKAVMSGSKKRKFESGWAYTGNEYTDRKGKGTGDVKRKGKLEPYAYWPLDRKLLNRREGKKAAARKGLGSVLKGNKRKQKAASK